MEDLSSTGYPVYLYFIISDLPEHSQDSDLRPSLRHRAALCVQSVSVLQ